MNHHNRCPLFSLRAPSAPARLCPGRAAPWRRRGADPGRSAAVLHGRAPRLRLVRPRSYEIIALIELPVAAAPSRLLPMHHDLEDGWVGDARSPKLGQGNDARGLFAELRGGTSCVGVASASCRLDEVLRAIREG